MPKSLPKVKFQTIVLTPRLKGATAQFPSIFRLFPEAAFAFSKIIPLTRVIVILSIAILLIFATIKQAQLLQRNREYLNRIVLKREAVEKELGFWQKIAEKYNNYPDAYLKIAELEYNLGFRQSAKVFIGKALSLNPDMEAGHVLGEQISR